MAQTILRLPAVKAQNGLFRSAIYIRVSKGNFPKLRSDVPREIGWVESEVTDYIQQRISKSGEIR